MREVFEKPYNFQTLSEKIPISEPTLDDVYIITIVYVRIVYYLAGINLTCVCSDSDKMKIPLSLQLPWMDIGRRSWTRWRVLAQGLCFDRPVLWNRFRGDTVWCTHSVLDLYTHHSLTHSLTYLHTLSQHTHTRVRAQLFVKTKDIMYIFFYSFFLLSNLFSLPEKCRKNRFTCNREHTHILDPRVYTPCLYDSSVKTNRPTANTLCTHARCMFFYDYTLNFLLKFLVDWTYDIYY